jgi:hypothetical protein
LAHLKNEATVVLPIPAALQGGFVLGVLSRFAFISKALISCKESLPVMGFIDSNHVKLLVSISTHVVIRAADFW